MSARRASEMDVYVGSRLRQARITGGLSQEDLAESVGLTFQQIQKYERGANRVSAVRLYQFSRILDVEINYFYDEIEAYDEEKPAMRKRGNNLKKEESDALVRAYSKIKNPAARETVLKMIQSLPRGA